MAPSGYKGGWAVMETKIRSRHRGGGVRQRGRQRTTSAIKWGVTVKGSSGEGQVVLVGYEYEGGWVYFCLVGAQVEGTQQDHLLQGQRAVHGSQRGQ